MASIALFMLPGEKVAFVGDIHLDNVTPAARLDDYLETCCRKLEAVGDMCLQENVRYLFFAGDIFNKINCSHECVNRAGKTLYGLKVMGLRLFSICGNHDLLRDSLKNIVKSPVDTLFSFGVLEHVSLSTPVEIYEPVSGSGRRSVKVTACDFTQPVPAADPSFTKNILLAHMFFDKTGILGGEDQNISSEQMEAYGYDIAFLGHDHEEYAPAMCGKTLVVRPGSLLRMTVHDYNFSRKPGFVIVDDIFNSTVVRKVIIPHRPYQDVVSRAALGRKAANAADGPDRSALRDLAGKLAETGNRDGRQDDAILEIIRTDSDISDACRKILMEYIDRAG